MNGFIKFPVALYTLSMTLSLAQSRVLAVIVRQTIGWHKTRDAVSLSQFQHGIGKEPGTGMSRTHVIAAIRWLENAGIIRVARKVDAGGISQTSIYGLAERYLDGPTIEMDPAALEAMGSRKRGAVSQRDQGGSHKTRPTKDQIISKETSSSSLIDDRKPHDDDLLRTGTKAKPSPGPAEGSLAPPVPEESRNPAIVADSPAMVGTSEQSLAGAATMDFTPLAQALKVSAKPHGSTAGLSEALSAAMTPTAPPATDSGLLSGLLGLGFSNRLAQQLLATYPAERVQASLENLPRRKARNPAGYLLSELKSGDYAPPAAAQPARKRIFGLPAPSAAEVAQSQQAESESARLQQVIDQLDPERRAAFWQEAKRNCARIGRKDVPEDSPLLQAQFELIVQQHVLNGGPEAQRCA